VEYFCVAKPQKRDLKTVQPRSGGAWATCYVIFLFLQASEEQKKTSRLNKAFPTQAKKMRWTLPEIKTNRNQSKQKNKANETENTATDKNYLRFSALPKAPKKTKNTQ
jgi:hypothetical protein